MNKSIEALKPVLTLALEALEQHGCPWIRHEKPYNEAITAIREALASKIEALAEKPAQQERAMKVEGPLHVVCQCDRCKAQELVSWRKAALRVGEDLCSVGPFGYYDMTAEQWLDWALSVVTVHTPPASKPWVGLTFEERESLWDEWENGHVIEATEDKLQEKNA